MQQVEEEFAEQRYSVVVEVVTGELAEDGGCDFTDAYQRKAHCAMLIGSLRALSDHKVSSTARTVFIPALFMILIT